MKQTISIVIIICYLLSACKTEALKTANSIQLPNLLNYSISPENASDRSGLMWSDQGAWFAYSFPDDSTYNGGFSGPFLLTQENGVWSSPVLSQLIIFNNSIKQKLISSNRTSFNSHLEQSFTCGNLELHQTLVFHSGNSAIVNSEISNTGKETIEIDYQWKNNGLFGQSLSLSKAKNELIIHSKKSTAIGHILFPENTALIVEDDSYSTVKKKIILAAGQSTSFTISQSFIFPEYSWKTERNTIRTSHFNEILATKILEKEAQLNQLLKQQNTPEINKNFKLLLAKAQLTLQNNWRIPAGELKYAGLFPSYHYKWFNGFWSWDSWKHAVGLSYYNTKLAKDQIRAMFHFQKENGFIVDCVYRDTTIEAHNYRNSKPPLSAWAVAKIYEKDKDLEFIKELYPKLKKYHDWWYNERDHDKDGLCEYGSTDGSLVAAKWESGMDNAIRFDNSKILFNSEGSYSLDQESVDLNAYLYAEKRYLAELASFLLEENDKNKYISEAKTLMLSIQKQFYDPVDGWFYDTNLEGNVFIKGEGSEGWTPLWAKVASQTQAKSMVKKMMNPEKFFTKIPFQTMTADHEKFDPHNGYWRGPNWLDQAYFGVKGLKNYGFQKEADSALVQLLNGTEDLFEKGISIRENYHPISGTGLNAKNFSWSAAHIIMLLQSD